MSWGQRMSRVVCFVVPLACGAATEGCAAVTSAGDYKTSECAVNSDCPGDNTICRKSDRTCQSLVSNECKEVLGDYRDDNSIILGATVALSGPNASVGIPEKNAIRLALSDFTTSANGLPPVPGSTKNRPLAVVVCDDASTNDVGARSAQHLSNTVGVPVIIGPTWSGVAVKLLTEVTVPAQTLMIGTGTTSPDLTSLPKDGLFFRTIASMVLETAGMSSLVLDVEKLVRSNAPLDKPIDKIKLTLMHKGDSYGKSSAQAMLTKLAFNQAPALDPTNEPNFIQKDYGDSGNPQGNPLKYPETVAAVLEQKPHIIVAIGTGEVFANLVGPVEQSWDASLPYRPYWVFPHNQFTGATTEFLKGNDPTGNLRKRFVGATPGSENQAYQTFKNRYRTEINDGTNASSFGASNTYDSVYVAAFAIASLRDQPITGKNLSNAIKNLITGPEIQLGALDLNRGLAELSAGRSINITGVSGPLDFDLATGDVAQETQVWCIPLDQTGTGPGVPVTSGFYFEADAKTPRGSFEDVKGACAW